MARLICWVLGHTAEAFPNIIEDGKITKYIYVCTSCCRQVQIKCV